MIPKILESDHIRLHSFVEYTCVKCIYPYDWKFNITAETKWISVKYRNNIYIIPKGLNTVFNNTIYITNKKINRKDNYIIYNLFSLIQDGETLKLIDNDLNFSGNFIFKKKDMKKTYNKHGKDKKIKILLKIKRDLRKW